MIPAPALAEWLKDVDLQLKTRDGMEVVADRWSAHGLMRDLNDELDSIDLDDPRAIIAAAQRFMARDVDIEALIADMIRGAAADPFFRPPFLPVSSEISVGLLLWEAKNLSIALGVTGVDSLAAKKAGKRGPASIGFTGFLTAYKFIKAGGATLSFWETDEIGPAFDSVAAGKCRLVERRPLIEGETILMDGRRQSFVIEHATSDVVYIQAIARPDAAPLAVEFDSETLDYVGAASTDEASSRIQMMVTFLRVMDRQDALPIIEEALASPHFFTRWHIMREYLAMDAERALPLLRDMAANDPHPQVRATAAQTLERFFPSHEEQQEDEPCPA